MKQAVIIVILFAITGFAQIKKTGFDSPQVSEGIISQDAGSLFSFLKSDNFSMNHSYSMSYSSFGSNGLALGIYTNSMMYKFADNLNVQMDASFVHSPYNTFGKDFQGNMNKFYISKAAVNYQPWKDVHITLQYRNMPYYDPYSYGYGRYSNTFYGNSLFGEPLFDNNNGFLEGK